MVLGIAIGVSVLEALIRPMVCIAIRLDRYIFVTMVLRAVLLIVVSLILLV